MVPKKDFIKAGRNVLVAVIGDSHKGEEEVFHNELLKIKADEERETKSTAIL